VIGLLGRDGGALKALCEVPASARRAQRGAASLSLAQQVAKDRPPNKEADRLLVMAALESVSYVVLFDEPTPCELIERCKPDVYVKGGDYDMESLQETVLVRSWGGPSLALRFVAGYSTTALVQRIRGNG
jgi:rfaE bifunctional protein nucleotidyltransferase chain/domain